MLGREEEKSAEKQEEKVGILPNGRERICLGSFEKKELQRKQKGAER